MSKRDLKIFIEDILESIELIEGHTKNKAEGEFFDSITIQDAITRRLEIIGEAVKNIPEEFKNKHPEISWKKLQE